MADIRSHAHHDRFAVAAALGGAPASPTVATCPRCGALHRDLLLIQTALRHACTPPRPRDLRVTTVDVARLRPALWQRILGVIGSSRDAVSRPLATGLTSLGIAGLVLTSSPIAFGAPASGAAPPGVIMQEIHGPTTRSIDVRPMDLTAGQDHPTDPILVVSTASVVAGAGLFVLRRIAGRRRAVR